jgi:hypothetical protein
MMSRVILTYRKDTKKYTHPNKEGRIMMRRKTNILLLLFLASLFVAGPTLGDDLFIYPNKGQTKQQQEKDKYECYIWAKQQTGFDPMAQPTATASPPAQEAKQQRREEAAQEQWTNQQAANYQQNRSNYNRAFSSCMEGRGYTVK